MKLFVSALEYSANIHLKYLLCELVKHENIELCGIFDEKIIDEILHEFSKYSDSCGSILDEKSGLRSCEQGNKTDSLLTKRTTSLPDLSLKDNALQGKPLCNISEVAVMGFIDVLKRARFFLTLRAKCLSLALKADKILLMDSSSFNIPLAKKIKARNCKKEIMYYILPQVWAWKPWRAKAIESNCDKLCAILPFEVSCYATKARFVGHPLLDEIKYFRGDNSSLGMQFRTCENFGDFADTKSSLNPQNFHKYKSHTANTSIVDSANLESKIDSSLRGESQDSPKQSKSREFKSQGESMIEKRINKSNSPVQQNDSHNLDSRVLDSSLVALAQNDEMVGDSHNIITFMPGSRTAEISRIFPIFLQVKDELKRQDSTTKFILVIPRKFSGKNLAKIYGDLSDFEISFDTHTSLLKSKFAFICSGTATLECALIGTPFVLGYLGRWIEAFVVKQFLHIRFVGLANILYNHIKNGENFHDELLQENLTAKNLLDSYYRANPSEFLTKSKILRKYLKSGSAKAVAKWLLQG